MIRKKWIDAVAVAGIVFALLLSVTLTYFPQVFALEAKGITMQYETELFDREKIMTVDILMDDADWEDMLENAVQEEYYRCDVVINGKTYYNVGIRPKGNTSLTQVANDDTTDRFSFKLEFDHYDSSQSCMGLDKLVLNNMISDNTYCKEYLSYSIMEYLGVETSLYSYASVSRNGENWGLYFALEAMEESYARRVFGNTYGELYKPENVGMGGMGGFGGGDGSDLAYTDDDPDSYQAIFDAAVFDPSKSDKTRLIQALKNISEGTDLDRYMDVDAMLRYIAANVFLVNDDSYFGTMLHNYYLYEEDGRLTMLPWDYNLAFGGFQSHDADAAVNRGIDDVVSGGNLESRPMIGKILEVQEYKEQYYGYLEELISGYFESGRFAEEMDKLEALIDSYVKEDPTAFCSYEEYVEAREMLELFCEKRAESIRRQLDGTLAGTASSQTDEDKVATAGLQLSGMGMQGGGGFGGGREGMRGGDFPDNAAQPPDFPAADGKTEGTVPEGIQPPGEGGGVPEGLEQPGEGGGAPEGLEQPGGNGGIPNGAVQPPVSGDEASVPADMQDKKGGKWDKDMQAGNFGFPSEGYRDDSGKDSTWLWIGISGLVMAGGLLFAKLYPRSRY